MVDYIVTDTDKHYVFIGDRVTDFRGNAGVFDGVTRGVEYNGTAMVLVDGSEYYASVWGLTVETIADEYEESYDLNWYPDDEYSGYYPEDEYNDLGREYDDIY